MTKNGKRRRVANDQDGSRDNDNADQPNEHEQELTLEEAEARDLQDLQAIAAEATVVEFDPTTGLPLRHDFLPLDTFEPIDGLIRLNHIPIELQRNLSKLHQIIKRKVVKRDMVPWAGVGEDTTRLRSFGFLGEAAIDKLKQSDVKLRAQEKVGREARDDERANWKAVSVLHPICEVAVATDADVDVDGSDGNGSSGDGATIGTTARSTINPTQVAADFVQCINPSRTNLDPEIISASELIAYQTNLHNGAPHLAAHLDAPLFEGFGKVIATYAVTGNATVLLIGKDEVGEGDDAVQPAWRFHLNAGEAYVLSGKARNMCLHAVLADGGDGKGGKRESLNLRFGLHTKKEAEEEIYQYWPELMEG